MYCENCGQKNEILGRFCENCGVEMRMYSDSSDTTTEPVINNGLNPYRQSHQENGIGRNNSQNYLKMPSKGVLVIIVFLAILLVTYKSFAYFMAPEQVVDRIMQALAKQDYAKAADYFDLPNNDFISVASLEKAVKSNMPSLLNYNLKPATVKDQSPILRNYNIKYTVAGYKEEHEMNMVLIKQKEKKYLIFENWKMSSDNLITKDWVISIPKGAELFIDNKKVSSQYQNFSQSDAYTDHYVIDKICKGQYQIKVTLNGYNSFQKEYRAGENVYINIQTLQRVANQQ